MVKFVLPELEKNTEEECGTCISSDSYQRILYIPVNKEILDLLDIDTSVDIKLKGKVVGLEAREGSNYSSHEIQIDLKSVEVDAENEFSELADDDDD